MSPLDLDLVPEPPASPAVLAARQRRALVVGLGGGREADSPMAKSSFAERRLRATDTVSTRLVDPLPGVDLAAPRADRCSAPRTAGGAGAATAGTAVGIWAADAAPAGASLAKRSGAELGSRMEWASASASGSGSGSGSDLPASGGLAGSTAAATSMASMAARASNTAAASLAPHATAAAAPSVSPPPSNAASALRLDDALVVPAGALMRGYLRCHALLLAGDVVGNVHCTTGPVVIRSGASLKGRLVAAGDVYVCGTVGDTGGGAVITTRGKLTLAPGARVDGDVRSGVLDVYDGAVLNGVAKRCED